ncbi:MAG: 3-phosphoshikimate 1-carboxyvinyltransferase [Deltaproteobacteria bacterium]|nr:MAG: 3-phosphoshikimate 1-carboxyvinyltransferase [Deltaproteobacteria bacterium]
MGSVRLRARVRTRRRRHRPRPPDLDRHRPGRRRASDPVPGRVGGVTRRPIWVHPPRAPLDAVVRPPGSKSLTNRALFLAALADGTSRLEGALAAEDTRLAVEALRTLGVRVEADWPTVTVHGQGGRLGPASDTVYVGTAGTVARFLVALAAVGPHAVRFDGSARMRERPMAGLVDALVALGGRVACEATFGALPLRAGGIEMPPSGGTVVLEDPPSSQFVSALLLAGLRLEGPLRIEIRGDLPARPYVDLTCAVIEAFGGRAQAVGPAAFSAEPARLAPRTYAVEPDASAASYLLAAAAIYGGVVEVPGVGRASLQGDARFAEILEAMGARVHRTETSTRVEGTGRLRGIDCSLADMPDVALTLAVVALHAEGPTTIRDVGVLRHHESDRIAAAATELRKFGALVTEGPDSLRIEPPAALPGTTVPVDTYADHRMAMAFSLAGDVLVRDPACVEKTYPGFFEDLASLGMVEVP